MASQRLLQKTLKPIPPIKGSFPLDHDGVCKKPMLEYMVCLRENDDQCTECRELAKTYLLCRMDNNLMAKEELPKLGFSNQS